MCQFICWNLDKLNLVRTIQKVKDLHAQVRPRLMCKKMHACMRDPIKYMLHVRVCVYARELYWLYIFFLFPAPHSACNKQQLKLKYFQIKVDGGLAAPP